MMATLYDVDACTVNYHLKRCLTTVSYERHQLSEIFG